MDRPVFFGGWQRKEVVGCSSEFGHRVGFKAVVLEFDETERGESRGRSAAAVLEARSTSGITL